MSGMAPHPRNVSIARLAVGQQLLTVDQSRLCLQDATQSQQTLTAVALARGWLNPQQAQYLLNATAPQAQQQQLSESSSDFLHTLQAAGPQGPAGASHPGFHGGYRGPQSPPPMSPQMPPQMPPQMSPGVASGAYPQGPQGYGVMNQASGAYQALPAHASPGPTGTVYQPGPPGVQASDSNLRPVSVHQHPSSHSAPSSGSMSQALQMSLGTLHEILQGQRYSKREQLKGGQWLVQDRRFERMVLMNIGPPQAQAQPCQEFFRTARILAHFDHPSIPRIHDLGFEGLGEPQVHAFYTMDWIVGESLAEALSDSESKYAGNLPAILRLFLDLCSAVAHAQRAGLIHSRLTPDSVTVGQHGQVLVRNWSHTTPQANDDDSASLFGFPAVGSLSQEEASRYAPEIRLGADIDERTDVWGLGSILFWMLCRQPFHVAGLEALDSAKLGGRALDPEVIAVVKKCLEMDSNRRYQSALDVQSDVQRFLDGQSVQAVKQSLLGTYRRMLRVYPTQTLLSTAASVILMSTLLLSVYRTARAAQQAQESEMQALADKARAERKAKSAQVAREAAEELAKKAQSRRQLEALLLEASRSQSHALKTEDDDQVRRIYNQAMVLAKNMVRADKNDRYALRQVRLSRADWSLRKALAPQSLEALKDYEAVLLDAPMDSEALLGKFLAMRRRVKHDDELRPFLSEMENAFFEDLGQKSNRVEDVSPVLRYFHYELKVRELESLIQQARSSNDINEAKALIEDARKRHRRFQSELKAFVESHKAMPIIGELCGRAEVVHAGVFRAGQGGHEGPVRIGTGYSYPMTVFDPSEAHSALMLFRGVNQVYSLHQTWRWFSGFSYRRLDDSLRFIERPSQLLPYIEVLQKLGGYAGSLNLLNHLFKKVDIDRIEGQLAEEWQLAVLYRARSMLALGMEANVKHLKRVENNNLRAGASILLAYSAALKNDQATTFQQIEQSFKVQQQSHKEVRMYAIDDLCLMLSDARIDGRLRQGVLQRYFPIGQYPPSIERQILAARVALAAQSKALPQREIQMFEQNTNAVIKAGNRLAAVDKTSGLAFLSWVQAISQQDPRQAALHLDALQRWTDINPHGHTEFMARLAQSVIVDRLTRLGMKDQARAFKDISAIDEIWVRRQWVPKVVHTWGTGDGGLWGGKQ